MENKVATAAIASLLSETSGKNRKFCEDFIREFFKVTGDALSNGENVRIKGFGTFKIVEVEPRNGVNVTTGERQEFAGHRKVVFTPAKEMASLINAPFEIFESVELEDESPEKEIIIEEEVPADTERSDENNVENSIIEAGSEEENEDDIFTAEAYGEANDNEKSTDSTMDIKSEKVKYRQGFFAGAMTSLVVCLIVFMLGCFFGWWPVNFGSVQDECSPEREIQVAELKQTPVETDTIIEQPEEGSQDEPEADTPATPAVYDTVSTTRYLTTIAREHYGNFNFWPYIYLENQSFLGHPDRIKPGTRIVVPPLSKYGINPQNKEDLEKAKKLSMEIYEKFR